MAKSCLYDFTPSELQYLLDNSNSYADLLRKVGINTKGGNPDTLKRIIKEYGLDETNLNLNRSRLYSNNAYKTQEKIRVRVEDVLSNKRRCNSFRLLQLLLNENLKERKCEVCGNTIWNNLPIPLSVHHKDGNPNNNALDNLQVLCANCHRQTDNYAGKRRCKKNNNVTKIKKEIEKNKKELPISRDELKDKIRNFSFLSISKEFNVSDNTIRKWCDKYNLPRHKRVIEKYSDEEWCLI